MSESILKEGLPYRVEKSKSNAPFWDGLDDKKFLTTKCLKCQNLHFPPTTKLCPICFGVEMEWVELPLEGTVTTFTKVEAPPEGFFGEYILASVLIDKLDKQILGRYLGNNLKMGDRVKVDFEKIKEYTILVFSKI